MNNTKKIQKLSLSQSFMRQFDVDSEDQKKYDHLFNSFDMNLPNSYQGELFNQTPYNQTFSRSHFSRSNHFFKCDECPKIFCSAEYLTIHKQNKHPRKEVFFIEIPSPTLSRPLNSSVSNNSNLDEKKVIPETFCEICQRNFCNKYFLVKHMKTVHGKQDEPIEYSSSMENTILPTDQHSVNSHSSIARKNWVCHICKQEYYSFKYLKNHLKKKHNSEEPNRHTESLLLKDNELMSKENTHILLRLRKRLSKKLKKNGILKKLPSNIKLSSMIRLLEFQKNLFGSFFKNKKWKKKYESYILNYSKKYHVKNFQLHNRNLKQKFSLEFNDCDFPKLFSKINFPKEIKFSVKTPIRENISANIILKPIPRKSTFLFKEKFKN